MYRTEDLFDLNHTLLKEYLEGFSFPWEALKGLGAEIIRLGKTLSGEYEEREEGIWIHRSAVIAPSALVLPPVIIDEGAEVRHSAFIRNGAVIGKGAVVGNSVEIKNAILFDSVLALHFNYVGDSILGYKAHLGAGAITSNVKSDSSSVVIRGQSALDTGLMKLGAMLGDYVEIGCNSVLNPGTIVGRGSTVYPLSSVRGIIEEGCIYKREGEVVKKEKRKIL